MCLHVCRYSPIIPETALKWMRIGGDDFSAAMVKNPSTLDAAELTGCRTHGSIRLAQVIGELDPTCFYCKVVIIPPDLFCGVLCYLATWLWLPLNA